MTTRRATNLTPFQEGFLDYSTDEADALIRAASSLSPDASYIAQRLANLILEQMGREPLYKLPAYNKKAHSKLPTCEHCGWSLSEGRCPNCGRTS